MGRCEGDSTLFKAGTQATEAQPLIGRKHNKQYPSPRLLLPQKQPSKPGILQGAQLPVTGYCNPAAAVTGGLDRTTIHRATADR